MKKNLDYIIKVSEYGNINKAAEKLYITPSALSKFVKPKEKEIGVQLFDRSGKKFVLTYAGEKYVEWAKKIILMQDSMNREMASIADEKIGIMHFGFQLMQSKLLFSKIIPAFKETYADIDIVLESTYTLNLLNQLEEGLIDFAITSHRRKLDEFEYKKLMDIEIVVIVPKGHPITEQAIVKEGFKYPWIDIKGLKDETFVGLYKEQEPRKVMDSVFETHCISPKISMQVHTSDLTILSVANKFGVTIGFDFPAKYNEYSSSVELLSFGDVAVKQDLSVIYSKDYKIKEYVKHFFEICEKQFNLI